eukprot:s1353_g10.t1
MDAEPDGVTVTVYSPPRSQGSRPTAAKTRASPRTARSQEANEAVAASQQVDLALKEEADIETAVAAEDDFAALKRRRIMIPGAQTSHEDFHNHFLDLQITNDMFQLEPRELEDRSNTILQSVVRWTEQVTEHAPILSDYFVRVAVAVLSFSRVRLADLYLREHALVYWIAEGGHTLRFHDGDCYMRTTSGAFQQHKGIPPDHDRVQAFLMHVEGIFRLIASETSRDLGQILSAVATLWQAAGSDAEELKRRCVEACLDYKGEANKRRGGRRPGADEEDAGEEAFAEVGVPWMILAAKTVLAVKKQISREITEDKLLHYMSEWCEQAKTPEPSCCYEDCAIAYDHAAQPAEQVLREALKNCYLRIPHQIKATVPEPVLERVKKFYRQTFWGNVAVFKCCQAAQALAKRGLNVTRLFIGLSGGGVGQSLYSTHLHAMYGHNAAFFDPNIWFNEDEMRKQVEQLNGCCILTGQETPGTNRKLREDLFKKFASGDGIAGRKPYGFRTRMIRCIGWKRLEANKLLKFAGVSNKEFNTILRRAFVWKCKARFEDPDALAKTYQDIDKDGIFPKDPDLGEFLISGPAIAAALQLQHAFEMKHDKEDCRNLIEQYVVWGGDQGLTEKCMREACSLPPREARAAQTAANHVIDLVAEPEAGAEANQEWKAAHAALVSWMLQRNKCVATLPQLKQFKCKDGPNVPKEQLLSGLVDMGLCRQIAGRLKAESHYMPVITTKKSLDDLINVRNRTCEIELPEVYNVDEFNAYVHGNASRRDNATILGSVCNTAGGRKRGAGRETEEGRKQREIILERGRKLDAAEKSYDELLEKLQPTSDRNAKRARMEAVKQEETEVSAQCAYHYPDGSGVRTRRQVTGLGAQKFPRRAQLFLLPHTHDLDIASSMFTLLPQLVEKLDMQPPLPDASKKVMERIRRERAELCENDLQVSKAEGKRILTAVFNGGSIPAGHSKNDVLNHLQKASIWYRWVAASLLPDEYKALCEDPAKKYPEASVLSLLYTACEDFVLSRWAYFLESKYRPRHMSLHFDGIRVSQLPHASAEIVCRESAEHIQASSSFEVTIVEKKHSTVFACLKKMSEERLPPLNQKDHRLCMPGNCILHALQCLQLLPEAATEQLENMNHPANAPRQTTCPKHLLNSEIGKCTHEFQKH